MDAKLITAARRLLIYPYLRHFDLVTLVFQDCLAILQQGKRSLLKCFLQLYHIFEHSETKYLLNTLYLEDYCIWIPQLSETTLSALAFTFETAVHDFDKSKLAPWPLEELEHEARMTLQVEEQGSDKSSDTSSSEEEESSDEEESSNEEESSDEEDQVGEA